MSEFIVKYIPYSLKEKPISFKFNVGEYVTIKEIRRKIEGNIIR